MPRRPRAIPASTHAGRLPWNGYGESIAAGFPTTAAALSGLIIDEGIADLGHRRHLLALDAYFKTHNQVGVGVVHGNGVYGDYYTIDTAYTSDRRPTARRRLQRRQRQRPLRHRRGPGQRQRVGRRCRLNDYLRVRGLQPAAESRHVHRHHQRRVLGGVRTQSVSVGSINARLNFTAQGVSTSAADVTFIRQGYTSILHRPASTDDVNQWDRSDEGGLDARALHGQPAQLAGVPCPATAPCLSGPTLSGLVGPHRQRRRDQ